jgi:hypothetical protein
MLPGPDYIYQCPNCGKYLKGRSLRSGNTFGAELFSDGKMIAPMLPTFPDLTKCRKCDAIFWLSSLNEIGTDDWNSKNSEWENVYYADFLGIEDLHRALKITKKKEDTIFIRQQIWWTFNDRVRVGKKTELFIHENEKDLWEQNCNHLLNLLDKDNVNQKIMIAELLRNLGQFERCTNLINELPNDFDWLKTQFETECAKKNTMVFKMKRGE